MMTPTWSLISSATSSPVTTSVRGGNTSRIAALTASMSAPSSTSMSIVSTVPLVSSTTAAVSKSKTDVVAPAKPSLLPRPTVPTSSNCIGPVGVTTVIVSPSS